MRLGVAFQYVALASVTSTHPQQTSLACDKAAAQLSSVLASEPVGTVTALIGQLMTCYGLHRICGVVYDHTQPLAHVFAGEKTSDVAGLEYYDGGASYAVMGARSFPPSPKSGFEYCLALTPGAGNSSRPFEWHGWRISPDGTVRKVDFLQQPTITPHTTPRSMAAALWNFYASEL